MDHLPVKPRLKFENCENIQSYTFVKIGAQSPKVELISASIKQRTIDLSQKYGQEQASCLFYKTYGRNLIHPNHPIVFHQVFC